MGGQRKKQSQRIHDREYLHRNEVDKLLIGTDKRAWLDEMLSEHLDNRPKETPGIIKRATDWLKNKIFPNS